MSNPDNRIVIQFEVSIPHEPGQAVPLIKVPNPRRSFGSIAPTLTGGACWPSGVETLIKVVSGCGSSGIMCVACHNDYPHPDNDEDWEFVWVGIYSSLTGVPGPDDPPGLPLKPGNGEWSTEIDNVPCSPGGVEGVCVIWRKDPDLSHINQSIIWFNGICSDHNDCERDTGSGIRQAASQKLAERVPKAWVLESHGFSGSDVEAFNGRTRLALQESPAGDWFWTNGECGASKPEINLEVAACGCSPTTLQFRKGDAVIRYTIPRRLWNIAGANRFESVRVSGVCDQSEVPSTIGIQPA